MGPLSYLRSVVDRNVVMRCMPVLLSPLRSCFQKPSPIRKTSVSHPYKTMKALGEPFP